MLPLSVFKYKSPLSAAAIPDPENTVGVVLVPVIAVPLYQSLPRVPVSPLSPLGIPKAKFLWSLTSVIETVGAAPAAKPVAVAEAFANLFQALVAFVADVDAELAELAAFDALVAASLALVVAVLAEVAAFDALVDASLALVVAVFADVAALEALVDASLALVVAVLADVDALVALLEAWSAKYFALLLAPGVALPLLLFAHKRAVSRADSAAV